MTQLDVRTETEVPTEAVSLDLYREVHKGLRRTLFGLCEAAGSLDAADPDARASFVARFAEVDHLLTQHHEHEDGEHLGNLIAKVAPQYVDRMEVGHIQAIEGLASLRRSVIALGDRDGDADALYDQLVAFVVGYLGHMSDEEHLVMPALSAGASFDELFGVQMALRGAIAPNDMVMFMREMLPAINTDERTQMLGGMYAGAPPEIFSLFWSTAAEVLTADQLAVVAGRIGVVA